MKVLLKGFLKGSLEEYDLYCVSIHVIPHFQHSITYLTGELNITAGFAWLVGLVAFLGDFFGVTILVGLAILTGLAALPGVEDLVITKHCCA